jgi:Flp pilus assembly protein TadG
VLESAVVLPVFLLLLIGFIVAAIGVFRFQEIAALAREGARYASVRGNTYAYATSRTAATAQDVYNNAIAPRMVTLSASRFSYSVTWSPDKNQGSLVTVQVTYQWVPEAFLGGINLKTTAVMPISY